MQGRFKKLINIIDRLRGKNGCPWDKEQNLKSIRENIIEEAYETVEAINNNDYQLIKDEVGDLLVQVVFISQLASEKNKFNIQDVINGSINKLVRRHPHVFKNIKVDNADHVLRNWENIKKNEKTGGRNKLILDNIPDILPALLKAKKVQNKVERFGFKWESIKHPVKKLKEEIGEFIELVKTKGPIEKREEEFGDILFTLVNIGRFFNINPEEALNKTIKKFIKRFGYIEQKLKKEKKNIKNYKLSRLENLWKEAKIKEEHGI